MREPGRDPKSRLVDAGIRLEAARVHIKNAQSLGAVGVLYEAKEAQHQITRALNTIAAVIVELDS